MSGNNLVDRDVSGNDNELFYLKWHNFQKNVSKQFERLREDDDLVDITFACDGKQIRAHKLVLFACSPYFKQLLKVGRIPCYGLLGTPVSRMRQCKVSSRHTPVCAIAVIDYD